MTDATVASTGSADASPIAGTFGTDSVEAVAEAYSRRMSGEEDPNEDDNAGADNQAAASTELAEAEQADASAAPPEEATGETQDNDPTDDQSPLERPRSWSKEKDAVWAKLDRDTQQYLLDHDSEVSKGVRKAQNEAAEARKAVEAERQQMETARKEYEAKLPGLNQALLEAQSAEFADIKTIDDVTRLAAEDPFRYLQFQAFQQKVQAANYEQTQAAARQAQERAQNWAKFMAEESAKAVELTPELADPVKSKQLQDAVIEMLVEKGFSQSELDGIGGGEKYSPFDHRFQSILVDAIKYRTIQKAKPAVLTKAAPTVQKPGTARPRAAADSNIQSLENRARESGSLEDVVAAYSARRATG